MSLVKLQFHLRLYNRLVGLDVRCKSQSFAISGNNMEDSVSRFAFECFQDLKQFVIRYLLIVNLFVGTTLKAVLTGVTSRGSKSHKLILGKL